MRPKTILPIFLASTSPRRIELMNQVYLSFEVLPPETDEKPRKNEKPGHLVARLAEEKAQSVCPIAMQRYDTSLIVAADTIVVTPDGRKILGKPKNVKDAEKMLNLLSGKVHSVYTGYCILQVGRKDKKQKVIRIVKSKVKIRPLTKPIITRYVMSGEPMDKAGSYAAQGIGTALIERIEGSYTNVIGLPMSHLLMDLEKIFKISLLSWKK